MHINGALPFHVAKAYDLSHAQRSAHRNAVNTLVTGRVTGGVEFAPAAQVRSVSEPLHLYARAADRIEAAVNVQIGRSIDVRA